MPSVAGKLESLLLEDRRSALVCHQAGHALYFSGPSQFSRDYLRAMGHELGMSFAGATPDGANKGDIEVFVSRSGHVTDWHYDYMENFTLQVRLRRQGPA
jgi:hypothetical protein